MYPQDKDKQIWAGTSYGLLEIGSKDYYSITRFETKEDEVSPRDLVMRSIKVGKGDTLWVATHNGLWFLKPTIKKPLKFIKPPQFNIRFVYDVLFL